MLAGLDPALLERVWFPLGDQSKDETRAEAARAGLAAARRPESQEACFLGGDDYRAFLERRGVGAAEGPIVDTSGKVLGRHDGHWRFTPGQRRGLGVAAAEPLYALRTIAAHEHRRRRPARGAGLPHACPRGACSTCPSSARTRSSATGLPRCPRASR